MSLILTGLAVVVIVGALVNMLTRREAAHGAASSASGDEDEGIDRAALEEAEREVRDMDGDLRGGASEDTVGDDWGPGTPKGPIG